MRQIPFNFIPIVLKKENNVSENGLLLVKIIEVHSKCNKQEADLEKKT